MRYQLVIKETFGSKTKPTKIGEPTNKLSDLELELRLRKILGHKDKDFEIHDLLRNKIISKEEFNKIFSKS